MADTGLPTHWIIRRAVPGDADAVTAMAVAYNTEDGDHPISDATLRQAIDPLLTDDQYGLILVAERLSDPGVFLGYLVLTWSYSLESGGRDGLIDETWVAERGQGIGTALFAAAVEEAQRRGLPRLFLETETHNEGARRLYGRFGFVVEESVWMARWL